MTILVALGQNSSVTAVLRTTFAVQKRNPGEYGGRGYCIDYIIMHRCTGYSQITFTLFFYNLSCGK